MKKTDCKTLPTPSKNIYTTRETKLLASADDLQLSVLELCPTEGTPVKGILQLVHGMCEHKERYIPFMRYMVQNGYICVIHDHRGHGGSIKAPEDLGFFYDGGYNAMIEDIKVVTDWIKAQHPGLPHILLGHSMGSMAVRSFAKRYDDAIDALLVCGSPSYNPALWFGVKITQWVRSRRGERHRPLNIQRMSFGKFSKKFPEEISINAWICSDRKVVEKYDNDPLCAFMFTTNGFYNLFMLMHYTYSTKRWAMKHRDLPIIFLSGEYDPCLVTHKRFRQAVATMRRVGYTNVQSHLYPKMRHEILNEKGKKMVWKDVLQFCDHSIGLS